MLFVEVILPIPVFRCFTYGVPDELSDGVRPGVRLLVPFGRNKTHYGIVRTVVLNAPSYRVKNVLEVYDTRRIVDDISLCFWDWMSSYYMCALGEVFKAAVPSSVKKDILSPTEDCVRWSSPPEKEQELQELLDSISKRAPKQSALLSAFIELSCVFSNQGLCEVTRQQLLQHCGMDYAALRALIHKKILSQYERPVFSQSGVDPLPEFLLPTLSVFQERAVEDIVMSFKMYDVTLLHGVPSSGKTEIYLQLIGQQIQQGKQVLYLLPEIALTTQMVERLSRVFGKRVGVYHSRFSDARRMDVWNKVNLCGPECQIILGVRSSLFLPFKQLGLIIVDEEHENSYKQHDPAPRYHGRDASILLASMHGAKVLLGTATPSVESYFNARVGKYGLVELSQRYQEGLMPELMLLDVKAARKRKQMRGIFHPKLVQEMEACLSQGEQVLLFQNRRGFAPYVQCNACGYIPYCISCDVSLTYHKDKGHLVCHYCGSAQSMNLQCPRCDTGSLSAMGYGTERIEEEVCRLFPGARVARMDGDTVRTRDQYEDLLHRFEHKEIDILCGTQIISKGLDFEHIRLVGVINADNLLNHPDFRAFERSYQLLAQVSGRAGRRAKQGLVLLQASDLTHPILKYVLLSDYQGMYLSQLQERKFFRYPPFYRLIRITVKHKQIETARQGSVLLSDKLKAKFGDRVMGPEAPVIAKMQQYHLRDILLKIEKEASVQKAKSIIREAIDEVLCLPAFRSLIVTPDVDPY